VGELREDRGVWARFPELDALLADLVAGAREALGDGFVGAYLHGSFALGAADEHSDVDFVVATEAEPDEEPLQRLHAELHAREAPWAQHLEGSYLPRAALRRLAAEPRAFLFLDNGARTLVRDPHCDTAVMRWTLRERGVVLAGPPPAGLVDPVEPEELRAEARRKLHDYADWAATLAAMTRWQQPYLVLTACRLLWTVEHATIAAKPEAARWALGALDPRWAPLIRAAVADRPDPWLRVHQAAPADAVAETLAFLEAQRPET
jgi:predicted nucleotidyltransferase